MKNFIKKLLNTQYYTSKIDQFLLQYNKSNTSLSSSSQQAEIKKYARIFSLRDKPAKPANDDNLWS